MRAQITNLICGLAGILVGWALTKTPPMFYYDAKHLDCINKDECADAIALIAQLGRFDLVSLLIAVIGLILVLGGVLAYIDFQRGASRRARLAAEEIAPKVAERAANEYIQREFYNIYRENDEVFKDSQGITGDEAFGAAQENGE